MNKFLKLFSGALIMCSVSFAQKNDVPKGWHLMD